MEQIVGFNPELNQITITSSHFGIYINMSDIYLVPRCRKAVVFLLEGMDSLEAHMQLSWTLELGKVCHQELWLRQRGRERFLHRKDR